MSVSTYDVDPGDPTNDQTAARAVDDLREQIDITLDVLNQAEEKDAGLAPTLAALAVHLVDKEDIYPRDRLGTLLALALINLAAHIRSSGEVDRIIAEFTPRTWSLPAEPGPEVTRLRDRDGHLWKLERDGWIYRTGKFNGDREYVHRQTWHGLLMGGHAPLTDATHEPDSTPDGS